MKHEAQVRRLTLNFTPEEAACLALFARADGLRPIEFVRALARRELARRAEGAESEESQHAD